MAVFVSNRWIRFAESIFNKGIKTTKRYNPVKFILFRPFSFAHHLHQQWVSFYLRLRQQINLPPSLLIAKVFESKAIQPYLRAESKRIVTQLNSQHYTASSHGQSVPSVLQLKFPERKAHHKHQSLESFSSSDNVSFRVYRTYSMHELDKRTQSTEYRIKQQLQRLEKIMPVNATYRKAPNLVHESHATRSNANSKNSFEQEMTNVQNFVSPMQTLWHGKDSTEQMNIERIADQVLRQLDRRVIAMRERMGKV